MDRRSRARNAIMFIALAAAVFVLSVGAVRAEDATAFEQARKLLDSGQAEEAGALMQKVFESPTSMEKNTSEAYLLHALVLKGQGRYDEAIKVLNDLIARDKDAEVRARVELADAYIKRTDCPGAACAKGADDFVAAQAHLDLAMRRIQEDSAQTRWTETRQAQICNIHFLSGIAWWGHPKARNLDRAMKELKEAEACPQTAQYAAYWIGQVHYSDRKYNAMMESFRKAADPASQDSDFTKKMQDVIKGWEKELTPWHASVSVGGTYDSNVVAKPDQAIDGLNISHKSDAALITTAMVRYQPNFDNGFIFAAQYDLYSSVYRRLHQYNTIGNSFGVTVGQELVRNTLRAYLQTSYSYFYMDGRSYMSLMTLRPTVDYTLWQNEQNSSLRLQAGFGYSHRNMMNTIYSLDENRDANIASLFGGLVYSFANGNGAVALRGEIADERTEGLNWQSRWSRLSLDGGVPFSLFFDGELMDRLTLIFGADYIEQPFKNVHTVFGVKRHDRTLSGMLGLAYKLSRNIEARLTYTYSDVWSNIALYKYNRGLLYLGLTFAL